ncbi:flavoprotein-like protein [Macrophomina phaseolina]|uniref:Flavoprotein-like protein n=1 Tax=Macrophomina phaseolina TaxID=35725 RepID=A0ABQ8FTX1_9PEZI|nr:flavoprotein-like protein [Macrophomina phaseolina]
MPPRIAVVVCSIRKPRLNPFIAAHVHSRLAAIATAAVTVELLDLAAQGLPLYDEPAVPSSLPAADPTPHYAHAHTRAWSATVRSYDAFVFVTPQYNWSVPASLKNALDYLFHEWSRKPAAVVAYGSRGGQKAADHLHTILQGLRMAPVSSSVALHTHGADIAACEGRGAVGHELAEAWRRDGKENELDELFAELLRALNAHRG